MKTSNIQTITRDLTEMSRLATGLITRGIGFTSRVREDGLQIIANGWDAVCFRGTYGAERGLIECLGAPITDAEEPEGYLTADEILHRLDRA